MSNAYIPDQLHHMSRKELLEFSQVAHDENVKLVQQLAKANERVKELEQENAACAIGIQEIISRKGYKDTIKSHDEVMAIVNKFAIEQKIEMIEEIIKDCQSYSLDGVILIGGVKAKLEQLRKGKE